MPSGQLSNRFGVPIPTPLPARKLRLTTSLGQEIRRQTVASTTAELPLRGLAPGLYLLTVQCAGKLCVSQRVVLQ